MFVVERVARGHRYLYLVESVREGKIVRQRTIKALGRKDALIASGELDRLAASIARHSERSLILSDMEAGHIATRRIGGPLLFGRLWDRLGIGKVLEGCLPGASSVAVERRVRDDAASAVRLGSDRACTDWMESMPSTGSTNWHCTISTAMAWLGRGRGQPKPLPRCGRTDRGEAFERRKDLFTDLSLVFMDTTSLSFYGQGGGD